VRFVWTLRTSTTWAGVELVFLPARLGLYGELGLYGAGGSRFAVASAAAVCFARADSVGASGFAEGPAQREGSFRVEPWRFGKLPRSTNAFFFGAFNA